MPYSAAGDRYAAYSGTTFKLLLWYVRRTSCAAAALGWCPGGRSLSVAYKHRLRVPHLIEPILKDRKTDQSPSPPGYGEQTPPSANHTPAS